jgi:outer membrane protein OmpA-like peptidoglycan-associated protein
MSSIRSILFFLAVAGAFLTGYSQDKKQQAIEYLKLADDMKAGSQANYDIRDVLVQAANLDPENLKANFDAGYYHLLTVGKDMAVQYFLRVYQIDPNYKFDLEYQIGRSYQYGYEFDKAIDFYNRYITRYKSKPNYQGKDKVDVEVVERNIYECENAKVYVQHPENYSIVNMGLQINSEWDDYAPVLNEAEDEIIFTTRRREGNLNQNVYEDNKPWEDIFISRKVNGKWTPAENMGPKVNSIYHDSNLALSADGKTLFVHKDDNGGDIFFLKKQPDGSWSEPKPLPGMVNSSYAEKSVSISKDEKTLYFSSNRPGGFGLLDIYKATINSSGQWVDVKNLGEKINTQYDDDGPFIDYDGKTLYFSSKGHQGMGGFDIYKTVFDEGTNEWSEPENLGYPINTPDNDIYFVSTKDGKRGYYSSVREDGLGYDDIYVITLPDPALAAKKPDASPVTPIVTPSEGTPDEKAPVTQMQPLRYTVTVLDAATRQPVEARVRLEGMRDNIIVPSSGKGAGITEFSIVAAEAKEYRLSVEHEGYMFVSQNVRLEGVSAQPKALTRTIELRKVQTGAVLVLRNIYFDFDRATFKQESYNELNKLERMMAQNPTMQVEIAGHTDYVGTASYNMTLSQRRAEAVKDFLTKKGIDSRRIVAKGYGKTRPIASNDDEEDGRELNRRVEFRVISN